MKSVVLTLPDHVHAEIESAAQRERKAAPQLIVDVVSNWLATRAAPDTERQLREYVQVVAGTTEDLDPDLETVGIESLLDNTVYPGKNSKGETLANPVGQTALP